MVYDGNGARGGSVPVDTTSYFEGQTVTVLGNSGNLTRTGYAFVGRNTEASRAGNSYVAGDTFIMGDSDVVLFAMWTIPTYTVTYDGNGSTGGSVPIDTGEYQQGQIIVVLGNTGHLAKTGFAFMGWNTQPDGRGAFRVAGGTLTMGTADMTLYAVWEVGYRVYYNANGALGGDIPVDSNYYAEGMHALIKDNTVNLILTGYTFAGWNTAWDGSGINRFPGSSYAFGSSNVTLYAI